MNKQTIIVLALAGALLTGLTIAQPPVPFLELPHTFQPNTPALSSQVNENFAAIQSAINTNRTDLDAQTAEIAALAAGPADLVTVSPSGADFTSVAAALASITDAAADRPFVVLVFPGVYEETDLVRVPAFVHLKGVSQSSVVIQGDRSAAQQNDDSTLVRLENDGRISDLTIHNRGASAAIAIGILADDLGEETVIERVNVRTDGTGGNGHFAILVRESDVVVRDSSLFASGASIVNTAFGSVGSTTFTAQPLLEGCQFDGVGTNSGFGLQLSRTAAQVNDSNISGQFRAVSNTVSGITLVRNCRVETLALSPVYEVTGSAAILSSTSFLVGGQPVGISTNFKYVHCFKSNHDPVTNGTGSDVTP